MKVGFFSNFEISHDFLRTQLGEEYCQQHEVLINPSGALDLAFTFNYSNKFRKYLHRGPEYFLVMEPEVPGLWHTFVGRRSRKYRKVFSPHNGLWSALPWHVGFNFEQLQEMLPSPKTRLLSAIASTAGALPGHKSRLEYITALQNFGVNFDLFGRGREVELAEKSEGLLPYMYSVAIENSNQAGYFTEKIFDPILCWTVPIYVGAPDIEDYLPSAAYVSLPPGDPELGAAMLSALSEEDYKSRLPALADARKLILERYSMGAVVRSITAGHQSGRLRVQSTFGFNLLIHRIRDFAARVRGV